jgi:hypothetical protein
MSSTSIALYINWKHGERESPLLDCEGNQLLDVEGKAILCDGGWNDPRIVGQCNSAVKAIHGARGHTGEYEEWCSDCFDMERIGHGHEGCTNHCGHSLIKRHGCPIESRAVSIIKRKSRKDGEGYQPSGDSPLAPFDQLKIRQHTLSSNKIEDLQFWVLILIYQQNCFLEVEKQQLTKRMIRMKLFQLD